MAHFAQINENNEVIQVIRIDNEDISDSNGVESEAIGVAYCLKEFGSDTRWLQTSYNDNIRNKYAGIGDLYIENLDAFVSRKPHNSWILNQESLVWESPLGPYPDLTEEQKSNHLLYSWNEELHQSDDTKGWELIPDPFF